MEPEGSLPHSQVPTTCPYPEPDQSNRQHYTKEKHVTNAISISFFVLFWVQSVSSIFIILLISWRKQVCFIFFPRFVLNVPCILFNKPEQTPRSVSVYI